VDLRVFVIPRYARRMPTDDLDETIEETFPASDAPANTPETGIRVNGSGAAENAAESDDATADHAEAAESEKS